MCHGLGRLPTRIPNSCPYQLPISEVGASQLEFLTLHMLPLGRAFVFFLGQKPCHSGIYSSGQEECGFEWLATGTMQKGSGTRGHSHGIGVGTSNFPKN